ncbi:hypothetical protein, partial [Staphylococcus capitis]|uniref:hypothetical protein n=1 Tax=Staphylococcus capitis TaxID=29388 RepID=UPI001C92F4FF
TYINSLHKINHPQTTPLLHNINQSHHFIQINHILHHRTNLNHIIHDLPQSIIHNYPPTNPTINYINPHTQLTHNFKQPINNPTNLLNKTKPQNLHFETVDALKDPISET